MNKHDEIAINEAYRSIYQENTQDYLKLVSPDASEITKQYAAGKQPPKHVRLYVTYKFGPMKQFVRYGGRDPETKQRKPDIKQMDRESGAIMIGGRKNIQDFVDHLNTAAKESLQKQQFEIMDIQEDPNYEAHERSMASYVKQYGTASE